MKTARLNIETLWNPVNPDVSQPFGTRVIKDQWERKSLDSYGNMGGWTSREEWRNSVKRKHDFSHFDEYGRAVFKTSHAYGIGLFQRVWIEE